MFRRMSRSASTPRQFTRAGLPFDYQRQLCSSTSKGVDTDTETFSGDGDGNGLLCQLNNHPDFRLRQARAKVALDLAQGKTITLKPLETHPAQRSAPAVPIGTQHGASRQSNVAVKERGVGILTYENPVRSNDGTSSGALVNDRLRMARRKALESMSKPLAMDPQQAEKVAPVEAQRGAPRGEHNTAVREQSLGILTCENPVRSNDGTSSGALVNDRLRKARRKALESMRKPLAMDPQQIEKAALVET